jgi:hypothetical protein
MQPTVGDYAWDINSPGNIAQRACITMNWEAILAEPTFTEVLATQGVIHPPTTVEMNESNAKG